MFGIGYQEMFIILVVALVVFGPSRLPELAGQVGRYVRDFRRMTADLTEEFEKTVAEADDIKRTITGEVTGMRSQVKSVSNSVKKDLQGTAKSGTAAAAKRPAAATSVKKLGAATERNQAVKKSAVASASRAKPVAAPVATKADPLADVSMMEDEPVMPSNGVPIGSAAEKNGSAAIAQPAPVAAKSAAVAAGSDGNGAENGTVAESEAIIRARRRRASAGYGRHA